MDELKVVQTAELTAEDVNSEEKKKDLNRRALAEALQVAKAPAVHTDAEVQKRTEEYFNRCVAQGIKPTWEEYCLSLGVARYTVNRWEKGESSKISPDTIKRAREIIQTFDAKMVLEGKINPVTYFFRAKNYYGMKDTADVVVSAGKQEEMTEEDLINGAKALPD